MTIIRILGYKTEEFVLENKKKCETSAITSIWVEYAIALKEKEGLDRYVSFLKEKLEEYPDANDLNYTFNSAMYQKLSITDPNKAEIYLKRNIDLEPFMAIPEIYHNRVHFANNKLYMKEYDKTMSYSLKLLRETDSIGLKNESGRIANILGCVFLIQNNVEKAKEYFEYAMNIYQNNNYISYLWPVSVNYVTLYYYNNDVRKVFDTIQFCINIFQKYHKRTNNLNLEETHFSKLYVAYLL